MNFCSLRSPSLAIAGARRARRALFIQATAPAAYPPLIHATTLLAEAGWDVTFLSAPIEGMTLSLIPHPRITVRSISSRPSHVMRKTDYAQYILCAAYLALRLRPRFVYASDPLGAAPGLLAARLANTKLVYHEHDSPEPGTSRTWLAQLRGAAARAAHLIVFPNEQRARIAETELGFSSNRLHIVWNLVRLAELPPLPIVPEPPLIVYYHGSVTPERLPTTVVEALHRFGGRIRLKIAGYEAPGARGYVRRLVDLGRTDNSNSLVDYVGQISRDHLLSSAAHAHVGLALMPLTSEDINLRYMTGASNKVFDYMAAGLAVLVSELPDWHEIFVTQGFARACDPADSNSIATALGWFLDHTEERRRMAGRGRAKIETAWNFDQAFSPVMFELSKL
jgi:glycosyltransferase involved in cell wall biosynthesis